MKDLEKRLKSLSLLIRIGLGLKAFLILWVLLGFAIFAPMASESSFEIALATVLPIIWLYATYFVSGGMKEDPTDLRYLLGGILLLAIPFSWLRALNPS